MECSSFFHSPTKYKLLSNRHLLVRHHFDTVAELTDAPQTAPVVICNRARYRTQQLREEYNLPQGKPSKFKGIQKNPYQFIHWNRCPENAHIIPCTLERAWTARGTKARPLWREATALSIEDRWLLHSGSRACEC